MTGLFEEKLVRSYVGAQPVLIVVGPDGQSVRAFRDRIPGVDGAPDFYRMTRKQTRSAADGCGHRQRMELSGLRHLRESERRVPGARSHAQRLLVRLAEL